MHAFLTVLFLVNGYWIAILLNLPLVLYNAKKYERPLLASISVDSQEIRIFDNQHLLDATEIFRKLNVHKKVRCLLAIVILICKISSF